MTHRQLKPELWNTTKTLYPPSTRNLLRMRFVVLGQNTNGQNQAELCVSPAFGKGLFKCFSALVLHSDEKRRVAVRNTPLHDGPGQACIDVGYVLWLSLFLI